MGSKSTSCTVYSVSSCPNFDLTGLQVYRKGMSFELTFTAGGVAYSNARYGSGSGPIYLTDVLCIGSETSLLQCNSDPILSGGCSHSEDAGVKCEGVARRPYCDNRKIFRQTL